jgi:hypothetical protein
MDIRKPDPRIPRPGRDPGRSTLEARVRGALDIVLIVAMAAAPFLLVGSQQDDAQVRADAAEMSSRQLAQLPAP